MSSKDRQRELAANKIRLGKWKTGFHATYTRCAVILAGQRRPTRFATHSLVVPMGETMAWPVLVVPQLF